MLQANTPTAWKSFFGLAAIYECRPPYPEACVHEVNRRLRRDLTGSVIEIGAGTGIFTRMLASTLDPPSPVVAIEPNAEMREYAVRAAAPHLQIEYRDGIAERLQAADQSVKLLTAAAAAQRFNRPAFYEEAARVLQPGGLLMLVHNNPRDEDSAFFSEYLSLVERHAPHYRRGRRTAPDGSYQEVDFASELTRLADFHDIEVMTWTLEEFVDREKFNRLVLSSTILADALQSERRELILDEAGKIFDRHVDARGLAHMPYVTEAVFARRREPA